MFNGLGKIVENKCSFSCVESKPKCGHSIGICYNSFSKCTKSNSIRVCESPTGQRITCQEEYKRHTNTCGKTDGTCKSGKGTACSMTFYTVSQCPDNPNLCCYSWQATSPTIEQWDGGSC